MFYCVSRGSHITFATLRSFIIRSIHRLYVHKSDNHFQLLFFAGSIFEREFSKAIDWLSILLNVLKESFRAGFLRGVFRINTRSEMVIICSGHKLELLAHIMYKWEQLIVFITIKVTLCVPYPNWACGSSKVESPIMTLKVGSSVTKKFREVLKFSNEIERDLITPMLFESKPFAAVIFLVSFSSLDSTFNRFHWIRGVTQHRNSEVHEAWCHLLSQYLLQDVWAHLWRGRQTSWTFVVSRYSSDLYKCFQHFYKVAAQLISLRMLIEICWIINISERRYSNVIAYFFLLDVFWSRS